MSFTPVLAAALSGASIGQLSYWRSGRTPDPLLAPEHYRPRTGVSYSYRDVLALRTFVYLRSEDVPLQRIRRAVASLRRLGEDEHLATYQLVAMGHDVVWRSPSDEAIDLTHRPGQRVLTQSIDIFAPFENQHQQEVADLRRPRPRISVDPDVRGGFPVIVGTRVPYDLVASLMDDGLDASAIADIYPSVPGDAAQDAVDFAHYVGSFARSQRAA